MVPSRLPLIRFARALFLLNGAIWLLFGLISLARSGDDLPGRAVVVGIIAVLMFGNAGAMILSALLIGKTARRRYFFFALAVVLANILLTVTDQFGLLDLLTLVIDLILLSLLVSTRKRFTT